MAKRTLTELDTSVKVIFKDGTTKNFSSIEEASQETKVSVVAIKIRCNKKECKVFPNFEWLDEHTKKSYQAKKSKSKGNNWEYELVKRFKELGYDDCSTSKGESKRLDNSKIDIVSESLPFYCQAKHLQNTPNYFGIEEECPLKDKPFVVCWKKANEQNKAIAMVPMDFFYELLKKYNE